MSIIHAGEKNGCKRRSVNFFEHTDWISNSWISTVPAAMYISQQWLHSARPSRHWGTSKLTNSMMTVSANTRAFAISHTATISNCTHPTKHAAHTDSLNTPHNKTYILHTSEASVFVKTHRMCIHTIKRVCLWKHTVCMSWIACVYTPYVCRVLHVCTHRIYVVDCMCVHTRFARVCC